MQAELLRSLSLLTTCFAAFGQGKPTRKAEKQLAAAEKGLIKVAVMYPFEVGKTFDLAYYETKHMLMVAGFLGANLVKYTIERGVASGIPNQPLPYVAIGTFYVNSLGEYQAAIDPNREVIRCDILLYTTITPVILVSEVVR